MRLLGTFFNQNNEHLRDKIVIAYFVFVDASCVVESKISCYNEIHLPLCLNVAARRGPPASAGPRASPLRPSATLAPFLRETEWDKRESVNATRLALTGRLK